MAAETDSSGTVIASYAYLPGSFAPETMTRGGVTYHYLKNARGDVTALVSSTGDVVARYTYDPWGSPLTITDGAGNSVTGDPSHIANESPWRYAGYFWDQESGMYYLQARYYRPDVARFISMDPFCACRSTAGAEGNYTYAGGNPIMSVDPVGTAKVTWKNFKKLLKRLGWIGGILASAGSAYICYKSYAILTRALRKESDNRNFYEYYSKKKKKWIWRSKQNRWQWFKGKQKDKVNKLYDNCRLPCGPSTTRTPSLII